MSEVEESAKTPTSLEVFGESVKRIVENIGKDFTEPGDDWLATLVIEGEDNQTYAIGLAWDLFDGEGKKDGLVAGLKSMMVQVNAVRYALVLSAWAIVMGKDEGTSEEDANAIAAEWRGHFQDHPGCVEQLLLHVADRDADYGEMAEIHRHQDRPPTLGEWTRVGSMSGRFPSLREALLPGGDDE